MRHPNRRSFLALAGSFAVASVVTGVAGCAGDEPPGNGQSTPDVRPEVPPATTGAGPGPSGVGRSGRSTGAPHPASRRSVPTRLEIPDIDLSAGVMPLGLRADGTLDVPPFDRAGEAGWYVDSPHPGQVGPLIIVGHIDSPDGPAVFHRLAGMRPAQSIRVTCADGRMVPYRVEQVQLFPKAEFPTSLVYGNLTYPGIRLITCGGPYQRSYGGYQGNTVVFGRMDSG